jgi:transcription-repair coupling factor (superfamily II helicase)
MGLVGLVQKNALTWKLRPDQKVVVKGEWSTAEGRLSAAEKIAGELAKVAKAA